MHNILASGSIRASPSKNPDYNFHWVRDAAIVMKNVIKLYKKDKMNVNIIEIMDKYVDTELEHSKHHPAEPKFELDRTPYKGDWGRPQNDGPALRGLVCLQLLELIPIRGRDLLKIIYGDISYTIDELNQPCFDLWEEQFGYHLYTRMIQYKFIKEALNNTKIRKLEPRLNIEILKKAQVYLSHHFVDNTINSSYNTEGHLLRRYDSSVLLGLTHIDYDLHLWSERQGVLDKYVAEMREKFAEIYPLCKKTDLPLLGRYIEDVYFDGNPWIISTIALYQYWTYVGSPLSNLFGFFSLLRDKKWELAEQLDRENGENRSVEKLTWNYAELVTLLEMLDFKSLHLL